ncbi:YceD family protein [Guyparkeria sp. 1SP6A2]|nr:YceD family protein [Guyparkeria sp. 1SP6A2]
MSKNDSQDEQARAPGRLTIPLDVRAACREGLVESGQAPLAVLPRCRDMAPPHGMLTYEVHFSEGAGVHPLQAEVQVSAPLSLECARCREPVTCPVSGHSTVSFVFSDDQAGHVDSDVEPVVLGREGRIRLIDLLEDELLMAVPLMPVHEQACSPLAETLAIGQAYESGQIDESVAGKAEDNPFASLAALKKDPDEGK